MYKKDLALNNLQWLISIKPNQTKSYIIYMYKDDLALNNRHGWYAIKPNQTKSIYL